MVTLLKQNMSFEYGLISKSKKESGVEKAKSLFSHSVCVCVKYSSWESASMHSAVCGLKMKEKAFIFKVVWV